MVTRTRFAQLDVARLAAVVMMVQGHAIGTFVAAARVPADGVFWLVYMPIRGLTAVTFLVVSGLVNYVGLIRDAQGRVLPRILLRRLRRGVALILVDYLLSMPMKSVWHLELMSSEQWFSFFTVGTLNIVGVSLLLLTVLMAVTRSDRAFARASLIAGLGILFATPSVHQVDWFAHLPAVLAHYLSFDGGSHFNIFPHASFIFLGAALGPWVMSWMQDGHRWTSAWRLVATGAGIYTLAVMLVPVGAAVLPAHDYWLSSPFLALERAGGAFVLIGVYAACAIATPQWAGRYALVSQKVLHIYVIHIVLIFGHTWVRSPTLPFHGTSTWTEGILVTLAVIAGSLGAGAMLAWLDRHRHRAYVWLRGGALLLLLYLLWYGRFPSW